MGMQKVRVEDYLAVIDRLCQGADSALAKSGQISKALGIANGTASTTLLRLAAAGLIVRQPYDGAKLTDLGRARSQHVVRRLRIIELWLGNLLGWDEEFVTREARQLEPVMSERLIEALDAVLNFPESDHYGQAIPRGGTLAETKCDPEKPVD